MDQRHKQRRDIAISRLIADLTTPITPPISGRISDDSSISSSESTDQFSSLLGSTLSAAIERNIDTSLHTSLDLSSTNYAQKIDNISKHHHTNFLQALDQLLALPPQVSSLASDLATLSTHLQAHINSLLIAKSSQQSHTSSSHRVKKLLRLLNISVEAREAVLSASSIASDSASSPHHQDAVASIEKARRAINGPVCLKGSPFGAQILDSLPKIEAQLLASVRRNVNLWFLDIRKSDWSSIVGSGAMRKFGNSPINSNTNTNNNINSHQNQLRWKLTDSSTISDSLIGQIAKHSRLSDEQINLETANLSDNLKKTVFPSQFEQSSFIFGENFAFTSSWGTPPAPMLESPPTLQFTPSASASPTPTLSDLQDKIHESVAPVLAAQSTYKLLNKQSDFISYYEKNRYTKTKVHDRFNFNSGVKDNHYQSAIASLTGEFIYNKNHDDSKFQDVQLPKILASIIVFAVVESTLGGAVDPPGRTSSSSSVYESQLISEISLIMCKMQKTAASLNTIAQTCGLLVAFKSTLQNLHPSSPARLHDNHSLATAVDKENAITHAIEEHIADSYDFLSTDTLEPLARESGASHSLPFGLDEKSTQPVTDALDFLDNLATKKKTFHQNEHEHGHRHTFSSSVINMIKSVHTKVILLAYIAKTQASFATTNDSRVEKGISWSRSILNFVSSAFSESLDLIKASIKDDANIHQAVQLTANACSLKTATTKFLATVVRGLVISGLIVARFENIYDVAESISKNVVKACDSVESSCRDNVFYVIRVKIDGLLDFALDGVDWNAKSGNKQPNDFVEQLISFLRITFECLDPLSNVAREAMCFGACSHISNKMIGLLVGLDYDDYGITPIQKINHNGIQNLALDVAAFETFSTGCGVPQLSECFRELRFFTLALLDRELVDLVADEDRRMAKYPLLDLNKLKNVLDKYDVAVVSTTDKLKGGFGLGKGKGGEGSASAHTLDSKDLAKLKKSIFSQI